MTDVSESVIAERKFYSGKINEKDVVLVFSMCGKVATSITASTLVSKFEVDFILFTGVAGAVDPELDVGDVVVGNSFYQHDVDASPLFPRFEIPLSGKSVFKPNSNTVEKATNSVSAFLTSINTEIESNTLNKFSIFSPNCYVGAIASGDRFIKDAKEHEQIKHDKHQTLAVEMEGAAVAQVCEDHKIDYIVIRTISDKADHSSPVDFSAFLTEIASPYSSGIVKKFFQ